MLGIIGAMDIEIQAINAKIQNKQEQTINSISFVSGTINGVEVVSAVCGMGKVNAAICAQTMILVYKPHIIINTGVAGAVSDKLNIGDMVIADALYEHDLDITPLGYPLGYIGGDNITKIPADQNLAKNLYVCAKNTIGSNVITGIIVSGDQFINSLEKKMFLKETFDASACEMEGAAIGHVCYANNVRFGVIRAISDTASGSADVDFTEFCAMAARNSSDLILNYINSL